MLPTPESHEPDTRRIEIRRKARDETLLGRVRFELGGESITVKQVAADESRRIAFQVIPGWDKAASACRLAVYGDDWPLDAPEDPALDEIGELALKGLGRK